MANMFFQWVLVAGINLLHPFFVSMTDIFYNSKDKELEISVHIFTTDFESTIRKYHPNVKIDILHPTNQVHMNQYVFEYLQNHLQIQVNEKQAVVSFVGYEQQSESIWTYLEIKDISSVQKINVINSLLHDYSTNQINMIHVKVGNKEQSYKLDYPKTKAAFNF